MSSPQTAKRSASRSVNYATTADRALTNTESLARHIQITGALTGNNVNLIAPGHNPGQVVRVHGFHFHGRAYRDFQGSLTGATVNAITSGAKSFQKIYDNGTDMVAR